MPPSDSSSQSRPALSPGDEVRTALGNGVVREVRKNGRVLVEVNGRSLLLESQALRPLTASRSASPPKSGARKGSASARGRETDDIAVSPRAPVSPHAREIDLHGLRVEEALARVDAWLDGALRDDVSELRIIHGRSGGRLRHAVHRRLAAISAVRAFALDPANPGVTWVRL